MRHAIFFDRDLTLIAEAPAGLRSRAAHTPEQVVLLPGAVEAVHLARDAGYLVVVVTNQPGPAKGEYSHLEILATHAALEAKFAAAGAPLDAIYFCEHHETGGPNGDRSLIGPCDCRKPKPGLLLRAARELGIDLARSWMLGDADRDLEAGRAAGARAMLVGERGIPLVEAVRSAVSGGPHAVLHRHQ